MKAYKGLAVDLEIMEYAGTQIVEMVPQLRRAAMTVASAMTQQHNVDMLDKGEGQMHESGKPVEGA